MNIPPIADLTSQSAKELRGVFFDIDDTFTTHGKILRGAFAALWKLKDEGLRVVPITGRPAGWCDHIARMWPVDGVVGENGAFYFWHDERRKKLVKRFMDPDAVRREKRKRLEEVGREILESVPGAALASDQLYREADLAVDFCEDVPPLPWSEVERIAEIFRGHGANHKISSIHVNGWFGEYDKLTMTRILAEERWGEQLALHREEYLFCGDSPNDEPIFRYFPICAGVRNIDRFAGKWKHLPAFVSEKEGSDGFAEIVEVVLKRRAE